MKSGKPAKKRNETLRAKRSNPFPSATSRLWIPRQRHLFKAFTSFIFLIYHRKSVAFFQPDTPEWHISSLISVRLSAKSITTYRRVTSRRKFFISSFRHFQSQILTMTETTSEHFRKTSNLLDDLYAKQVDMKLERIPCYFCCRPQLRGNSRRWIYFPFVSVVTASYVSPYFIWMTKPSVKPIRSALSTQHTAHQRVTIGKHELRWENEMMNQLDVFCIF